MEIQSTESLLLKIEELQSRLNEAEQIIEAIKAGEVDAFAFNTNNKSEVFTLQSGDYAYRVLVENFSEGALNLSEDGLIVYTNKSFHETLRLTYDEVIGQNISRFIHPDSKETFRKLFKKGLAGQSKGEINLIAGKKSLPVYASFTSLYPNLPTVGLIISNLTDRKLIIKNLAEKRSFRNMFQNAPAAIAVLGGPKHKYILANNAYQKLFNRQAKDFYGKSICQVFPELKDSGVFELVDRVYETGEAFTAPEYALFVDAHNDGVLWKNFYHFSMEPLKNDSGEIYAVIVMIYDITEQVESRKRIENDAEKLRLNDTIFKTIHDAIISFDVNGRIVTWNESAEALYGFSSEEMIGQIMHDMIPTEFINEEQQNWKNIFYEKGEWRGEVLHTRKDRKKIYVSSAAFVIKNTDNEITGYVAVNRDITIQKQTENIIKESEKELRKIKDQLELSIHAGSIGLWHWDVKNDLLYWSEEQYRIYGFSDSETITRSAQFNSLILPEDLKRIQDDQSFGTKLEHEYDFRVKRKNDGEIRWIKSRAKNTFDEQGALQFISGVNIDITEQTLILNRIQESEERFRNLAETLPQMIWVMKSDGEMDYGSTNMKEYSGCEDVMEAWNYMIHPKDKESLTSFLNQVFAMGKGFRHEVRLKNKAGVYRWFYSIGEPLLDADEKVIKWVCSLTDIDEQKNISALLEINIATRTEELNKKNIELQNMNKELEAFAYITSHDLQEPLRKIQTFAGRISATEKENLSETGKEYFLRMNSAAERMRILIQDLFSFCHVNSSERKFEITNLNTIVAEVKNDCKEALDEKQATIEVEDLCEANIIPFQFRQLMYNLISNALKFSKPNIPPRIIIKSKIISAADSPLMDSVTCHITFSDNGIGFEKHFSVKIFELFKRLHGKETYEGTGIGLAIVKKIVDNHNGIITATSEINNGAQFDIYLPV